MNIRHKNILYGICGIGSGHTYRQLPIIRALVADGTNTIVVLAYGTSLRYYREHFANHPQVIVLEVAVPYYIGTADGIDFAASADHMMQQGVNYTAINARALAAVTRLIGRPDIVISDYEPVSAQYAYAYGAPLVTIDQQSKYLYGAFPERLAGQGYIDEVMRLRMFFPTAAQRIACSFFAVSPRKGNMPVTIIPPVLRHEVQAIAADRAPDPTHIVVYLTAQPGFTQPLDDIAAVLQRTTGYHFDIFTPTIPADTPHRQKNITWHQHNTPAFDAALRTCGGIIATAGHSLLAEAMYLSIPVYAMPLPLYEQHMNADIIAQKGFGLQAEYVEDTTLNTFLTSLPGYTRAIRTDTDALLRGDGLSAIMQAIKEVASG